MITFLKNKSLFITVFSFLIFGCSSVPDGTAVKNQSKIPLWTSCDTISHVFPDSDYIARIGHGDNAESAKLNADSELASYFNHSVKTDIVARQNYSNQKGKSDIQKYLTKNISVQNDVEVIGLKHTDFYFDSAHNDFIVCSYINRNDAWKLLEPKLDFSSDVVKQNYSQAETENELYTKILLLNRALSQSEDFYKNFFMAMAISPKNAETYEATDDLIQQIYTDCEKLKKQTVIFVKANGETSEHIKAKLESVFMDRNFIISASKNDYNYLVDLESKINMKKQDELFNAFPELTISVTNKTGKTVFSYSKTFGRISAYSEDSCQRSAMYKIESDLKKNFLR